MDTRKRPSTERRNSAERDGTQTPEKRAYGQRLERFLNGVFGPRGEVRTPQTLAKHLSVEDKTVRNYLNGVRRPDSTKQKAIEDYLFHDAVAHAAQRAELRAAWEAADPKGRPPLAAPGPSVPTGKLVTRPDHIFGREAELAALVAALLAPGNTAALVLGDGGIGKTALTRHAAWHADVVARFGERRFEAELATTTSAQDMQAAIAQAVGADPSQGLGAIKATLAAAPVLLLCDNLETPWDRDGKAVESLLRELVAVPGVTLLGSIIGLKSPGGARWNHRCDLCPLPPDTAAELFLDRAHRIPPDDPLLPRLLQELSHIPLAIELMARQAELDESLDRVWRAWQHGGAAAVAHPNPDDPDHRHASLKRSIEFSLASPRLSEAARRLFRLLGALPAGLSLEDAEALLGAEADGAASGLRGIGLAKIRDGRLDFLPPVRRHAGQHHRPLPAEAAAWVGHFLSLLQEEGERIGMTGGDVALRRLRPEAANFDAAMGAATAAGSLPQAVSASFGYGRFCCFTGLAAPGLVTLATACRDAEDRLDESHCIKGLADVAFRRSDLPAAAVRYNEARLIYEAIGDRLGEANCIRGLADVASGHSDLPAAEARYSEARLIYGAIGLPLGEANCIKGLADVAFRRSDLPAAETCYNEARLIYEAIGDRLGEANCIKRLADVASGGADLPAAEARYSEARLIYEAIGDRLGEANCIRRLADLALRRSDLRAAEARNGEARLIYAAFGNRLGEANCIQGLADVALRRSDLPAAEARYGEARAIYAAIGDRLGEANCIQRLANVASGRSDLPAAEARYNEARPIYEAIGDRLGEANCIRGLAEIALACSDFALARAGCEDARARHEAIGDPVGAAICQARLGEIAAAEGKRDEARTTIRDAIRRFEAIGYQGNAASARNLLCRLGLDNEG
ncbi:MAG: tetratricopeptide repeat protein [Acetobacteraceae bacterium]|nr:tetratricopeptide repeat protein [Acetobacteraceae bacterium]